MKINFLIKLVALVISTAIFVDGLPHQAGSETKAGSPGALEALNSLPSHPHNIEERFSTCTQTSSCPLEYPDAGPLRSEDIKREAPGSTKTIELAERSSPLKSLIEKRSNVPGLPDKRWASVVIVFLLLEDVLDANDMIYWCRSLGVAETTEQFLDGFWYIDTRWALNILDIAVSDIKNLPTH